MQDDDIVFITHKQLIELVIANHDLKQKVKELQDEADRLRLDLKTVLDIEENL